MVALVALVGDGPVEWVLDKDTRHLVSGGAFLITSQQTAYLLAGCPQSNRSPTSSSSSCPPFWQTDIEPRAALGALAKSGPQNQQPLVVSLTLTQFQRQPLRLLIF